MKKIVLTSLVHGAAAFPFHWFILLQKYNVRTFSLWKKQTKLTRQSAGIKSKLNKIVWPYKYLSTSSICHQNLVVYHRIKCLRPQSCQQLLVLAICYSAGSSQLSGDCFSWSLWQQEAFGFLMVLEKNGEEKSKFRRTKKHSFSNWNIKQTKWRVQNKWAGK